LFKNPDSLSLIIDVAYINPIITGENIPIYLIPCLDVRRGMIYFAIYKLLKTGCVSRLPVANFVSKVHINRCDCLIAPVNNDIDKQYRIIKNNLLTIQQNK